ncbi:hypothetical protein V8C42DRAFT_312520 [Trichoderma barbatum]
MDASWNSVPDANVRRSPSCVRASCISSRLWAHVGAMPCQIAWIDHQLQSPHCLQKFAEKKPVVRLSVFCSVAPFLFSAAG